MGVIGLHKGAWGYLGISGGLVFTEIRGVFQGVPTIRIVVVGHGALFCRGLSRVSGLRNTGRRGTRNLKGLKMTRETTSFWTIFFRG